MKIFSASLSGLFLFFSLISGCSGQVRLDLIKLPPGFTIEIYAGNVPGARSMAMSPGGTLFVGTREQGKVYAVLDRDGDHRAETVITLGRGLNMPNGVAYKDGALYVAEAHRILRFPDIDNILSLPGEPQIVNSSLPTDRHHGWKFIRFGPDGMLYVPVGAPCNICDPGDPYATILRMWPDGRGQEIFARGIRNTVGFDWHPATGELWFTDNGRDWLGDDQPPDELNHAPAAGLHFGYPYRHGTDVVDPEYGRRIGQTKTTPPALELGAHVAPLGMRFYTGRMFPEPYRQQIFIAEHGSWNRSVPVGYRIVVVHLAGDKVTDSRVFAEGWLQEGTAWGRPVDLLVMPDGSLLVSDDHAGVIYRIRYDGGK
ncbi:MAG: sorbosone dehydrogenase [Deltaproteobacteria bacterium RIFOXYD12_FULL_57_12]|nr:MAG: sorbosone dehydrogenase [Deltaproteobacteria bacterium RIFOXYD12_FULL_57_12]